MPSGSGKPAIRFVPSPPRLGDLALVYIANSDPSIERALVRTMGNEFIAFRVGQDELRAVLAVPIDIEPGSHSLDIVFPHPLDGFAGEEADSSAKEKILRASIEIAHRDFDSSQLKVSREFTKKKSKALLARLKREQKAIDALWQSEPEPPWFAGPFQPPKEGIVTGLFGTRRVFNGKVNSVHYGLDIDGKIGEPIRAVQAGKVVMSAMRWASGGTIVLDHGGGLFTMYFHMSRRDKKPGDLVKAGQVLGAVGKTGRVTGPHLHLQAAVRTRRLDPAHPNPGRSMYVDPQAMLGLALEGDRRYLHTATGTTAVAADPITRTSHLRSD